MQSVRLYAAGDIRVEEIDRPEIVAPDDVLLQGDSSRYLRIRPA